MTDNADRLDRVRNGRESVTHAPERTSDVAQMLREAASIMRALVSDHTVPPAWMNESDRCVYCGQRARRKWEPRRVECAHTADCPVTKAREWLRRAGLEASDE